MKSALIIHWKDWCWSWNSNTLATSYEELTHWKRPWWWERLKAGEGDNREQDGWIASPTQQTWVWASPGRCESWTIKKAEVQRTDAFRLVLEKTLDSPLDSKEIKLAIPKGNQSRIFIGRTDAEAKAPSNTLATWCEKLTHWKRPWWWERLKAGEGDNR